MSDFMDFREPNTDIRLSPSYTHNPSYGHGHPRNQPRHHREPSRASTNATWISASRYMRPPHPAPAPIPVPTPVHNARTFAESGYSFDHDSPYPRPIGRPERSYEEEFAFRAQVRTHARTDRGIPPMVQPAPAPTEYMTVGPENEYMAARPEHDIEMQSQSSHGSPVQRRSFVGGFRSTIRRMMGREPRRPPPPPTGFTTAPLRPAAVRSPSTQPRPVEAMMAQERSRPRDYPPLSPPQRRAPVRQDTADTFDSTMPPLPRYSVHPPTPTTAQREFEEAQALSRQRAARRGEEEREREHEREEEQERYVTYLEPPSDADGRSTVAPAMSMREVSYQSRGGMSEHATIIEEDEASPEQGPARSLTHTPMLSETRSAHRMEEDGRDEAMPGALPAETEVRPSSARTYSNGSRRTQRTQRSQHSRMHTQSPEPLPSAPLSPPLRVTLASPPPDSRMGLRSPPVMSPVLVEPLPASDYDKMSAFHTAPSELSTLGSYWDRLAQFVHDLKDLPWSATRVTADYIPGDNVRARYFAYRQRHYDLQNGLNQNTWYAPQPGHQEVDLLAGNPPAPRYEGGYAYGQSPAPGPAMPLPAPALVRHQTPTYPDVYPGRYPSAHAVPTQGGGYANPEQTFYRIASGYGTPRSPHTRFSLMRDAEGYAGSPRSGRSGRSVRTVTRTQGDGEGEGDDRQSGTWSRLLSMRRSVASADRGRMSWYNLGRPASGGASPPESPRMQAREPQPNILSVVSGDGAVH